MVFKEQLLKLTKMIIILIVTQKYKNRRNKCNKKRKYNKLNWRLNQIKNACDYSGYYRTFPKMASISFLKSRYAFAPRKKEKIDKRKQINGCIKQNQDS